MRVAVVITRMDERGGAQSHVGTLARGLRTAGDQVVLVHGAGGDAALPDDLRDLERRVVPSLHRTPTPVDDLRAAAALRTILRDSGAEIVHLHTTKAGVLGAWAARSVGVPAVFTAHGWVSVVQARGGRAGRWLTAAAYRAGTLPVARIVALSAHDARYAEAAGAAAAGRVVQMPLGIEDDAPAADPANAPPTLVTIARHCRQKDAETLLLALEQLRDRPWRLCWLGGGPDLPRTRARLAELGLDARVELLGDVADVVGPLAAARASVLSSHSEGLPISVLEAMRAGLPVVASDVGAVREAVDDAGWICPPADVAALVPALRAVLDDPAECARRGARGRARFEAAHRADVMVRAHRGLYRDVVRSSRSTPLRPA